MIRSEKFSFIEVNVTTIQRALLCVLLINYNGKLGLFMSEANEDSFGVFVTGRSRSVHLWVLEDVEKQEWSNHI